MDDFDSLDTITEDGYIVKTNATNPQSNEVLAHSKSLGTYMKQLARFPVLSRKDEIAIALDIQKSKEGLQLAFLTSYNCFDYLKKFLSKRVNKKRQRMFDKLASDSTSLEVLQAKLDSILSKLVSGENFSKENLNDFKLLVIPVSEFHTLLTLLKANQKDPKILKLISTYESAKKRLSECNLRLVFIRAKRYMRRGMALEDLIQEGNIGLLQAIEKYDVSKGFKFSTFATYWIDQAFIRSLVNKSEMIRLPLYVVETIDKVNKSFLKLTLSLRREPTNEELAQECELPVDKIEKIRKIVIIKQQEETTEDEMGFSLVQLTHEGPSQEDELLEKEIRSIIRYGLSKLPSLEQRVLRLKFGIGEIL
jgi:RNA polymerase sigma factor (sigma-70 family)